MRPASAGPWDDKRFAASVPIHNVRAPENMLI